MGRVATLSCVFEMGPRAFFLSALKYSKVNQFFGREIMSISGSRARGCFAGITAVPRAGVRLGFLVCQSLNGCWYGMRPKKREAVPLARIVPKTHISLLDYHMRTIQSQTMADQ